MDWAEDLKFSIRKTTAKIGRRAAAAASNSTTTSSSSQQSPSSPSSPTKDESSGLDLNLDGLKEPPPKVSGGWANSASKSGKSRLKNSIEDERFKISSNSEEYASTLGDNIPTIPDFDDIQDEFLDIVQPPSITTVNRVITLKELNSELLNQKVFSSLQDIDLSSLTKCLQTQHQLDEPDILWEWDKLFTEVTAEIYEDANEISHNKKSEIIIKNYQNDVQNSLGF